MRAIPNLPWTALPPTLGVSGKPGQLQIDWWLYIAAYLLLFFLLLLLPTGRLPTRRWRWAGWLAVGYSLLVVPGLLVRRPLRPQLPAITNPVGLLPPSPVLDLLNRFGKGLLFPLLGFAAVASLVLRFRTARGVERQQLKWLAYAAVLVLAGFVAADLVQRLGELLAGRPAGRHPDRHRRGDAALPLVRHRPDHQPHPGLRAAHRHPR